jgi:hypothetical protein
MVWPQQILDGHQVPVFGARALVKSPCQMGVRYRLPGVTRSLLLCRTAFRKLLRPFDSGPYCRVKLSYRFVHCPCGERWGGVVEMSPNSDLGGRLRSVVWVRNGITTKDWAVPDLIRRTTGGTLRTLPSGCGRRVTIKLPTAQRPTQCGLREGVMSPLNDRCEGRA